jgi:hypothetical protein
VRELADRFQRQPLRVDGTVGRAHADIEHVALKVASRERYGALVNLLLLAGDQRTLVFVRTREDTQALADELAGDGFLALPIHGELAQAQRTRTLNAFRRGAIHTLIATDVAARGLDIADVTMVVHFDPPIDGETYVHRSGRTGRAGQKGTSCMLVQKPRANFVRRLYHIAGVNARWEGPPGAAEVRAAQQQRAATRAAEKLETATSPGLRAAAAQLLAGREPEAVVAALLAASAAGVCDPYEVKMEREVAVEPVRVPVVAAAPVGGAPVAAAAAPSSASHSIAAPVAARAAVPAPSIPRGDRYEVERRAERSAPVSPAMAPVVDDAAHGTAAAHAVAPRVQRRARGGSCTRRGCCRCTAGSRPTSAGTPGTAAGPPRQGRRAAALAAGRSGDGRSPAPAARRGAVPSRRSFARPSGRRRRRALPHQLGRARRRRPAPHPGARLPPRRHRRAVGGCDRSAARRHQLHRRCVGRDRVRAACAASGSAGSASGDHA